MPEWLERAFRSEAPLPAGTIALRLGMALVFGIAIAWIYRCAHGRESREVRTLTTTLVLLTVLLGMVSMVIGESIARAFGLVGALSIVRFRTVVEDTRDTAFVIFAVIVGMAIGTGLLLVPAVGVPIVGAAAIVLARQRPTPGAPGAATHTGIVRVNLGLDPAPIVDCLTRHAAGLRLVGVATARQGSALELTYTLTLRSPEAQVAMVADLNRIGGVQSVEIRSA